MVRRTVMTLCVLGLLGGCAKPDWSMEPPTKPVPSPELTKLSRFIGSWSGTAEWVFPTPEDMKAMMPEGSEEEMPTSFAGGGTYTWALDGMFLKGESWHEMGPDERMHYLEFWTWDCKAEKYRTWSFTDWGQTGEGWAWFDASDGDTIKFKGTTVDGDGLKHVGKGKMTFLDDSRYEWSWSERGPEGKMAFKGVSNRQR